MLYPIELRVRMREYVTHRRWEKPFSSSADDDAGNLLLLFPFALVLVAAGFGAAAVGGGLGGVHAANVQGVGEDGHDAFLRDAVLLVQRLLPLQPVLDAVDERHVALLVLLDHELRQQLRDRILPAFQTVGGEEVRAERPALAKLADGELPVLLALALLRDELARDCLRQAFVHPRRNRRRFLVAVKEAVD